MYKLFNFLSKTKVQYKNIKNQHAAYKNLVHANFQYAVYQNLACNILKSNKKFM